MEERPDITERRLAWVKAKEKEIKALIANFNADILKADHIHSYDKSENFVDARDKCNFFIEIFGNYLKEAEVILDKKFNILNSIIDIAGLLKKPEVVIKNLINQHKLLVDAFRIMKASLNNYLNGLGLSDREIFENYCCSVRAISSLGDALSKIRQTVNDIFPSKDTPNRVITADEHTTINRLFLSHMADKLDEKDRLTLRKVNKLNLEKIKPQAIDELQKFLEISKDKNKLYKFILYNEFVDNEIFKNVPLPGRHFVPKKAEKIFYQFYLRCKHSDPKLAKNLLTIDNFLDMLNRKTLYSLARENEDCAVKIMDTPSLKKKMPYHEVNTPNVLSRVLGVVAGILFAPIITGVCEFPGMIKQVKKCKKSHTTLEFIAAGVGFAILAPVVVASWLGLNYAIPVRSVICAVEGFKHGILGMFSNRGSGENYYHVSPKDLTIADIARKRKNQISALGMKEKSQKVSDIIVSVPSSYNEIKSSTGTLIDVEEYRDNNKDSINTKEEIEDSYSNSSGDYTIGIGEDDDITQETPLISKNGKGNHSFFPTTSVEQKSTDSVGLPDLIHSTRKC